MRIRPEDVIKSPDGETRDRYTPADFFSSVRVLNREMRRNRVFFWQIGAEYSAGGESLATSASCLRRITGERKISCGFAFSYSSVQDADAAVWAVFG